MKHQTIVFVSREFSLKSNVKQSKVLLFFWNLLIVIILGAFLKFKFSFHETSIVYSKEFMDANHEGYKVIEIDFHKHNHHYVHMKFIAYPEEKLMKLSRNKKFISIFP